MNKQQTFGAIYTPDEFAELLVTWAIRKSDDKVLDLGVGPGAFVFAAYERLLELGASSAQAQNQIIGAEIDTDTFLDFSAKCKARGLAFPNVVNSDFFDIPLSEVNAVVGNPPYVRRTYLDNLDKIRKVVQGQTSQTTDIELSRLSDLYIYFLLYGSKFLTFNGRLAVVTADSWLNVGYGKILRQHFISGYNLHSLITFDRKIFEDAQVKPVFILAEKMGLFFSNSTTDFIRVKNGMPTSVLKEVMDNARNLEQVEHEVVHLQMDKTSLIASQPWGIHFKLQDMVNEITSHPSMTPFQTIARTRIGLQTLAKEFFVLSSKDIIELKIEHEYLQPLAHSARTHSKPTIEVDEVPMNFIFYCSKSPDELEGTAALEYIRAGEEAQVPVRGKGTTVQGYQNKQRIKDAGRKHWYDLKSDLVRRGTAEILVPRLIYRDFTVVWNKARFVPGELFVEVIPLLNLDVEVYLAILSSSLTEVMLRAYAQVYGGGTYNINPGQIRNVPVVDITSLSENHCNELKYAYEAYLRNQINGRTELDNLLYRILELSEEQKVRINVLLQDLRFLAVTSKEQS